jgi:hypothetical protein
MGDFRKISNWFLSSEWRKSPRLRNTFHLFSVWFALAVVINIVATNSPATAFLNKSNESIYLFRLIYAGIGVIALIIWIRLTVLYFRYTLEGGRPIVLGNIFTFYAVSILIFGIIYQFIFLSHPEFYILKDNLVHWPSTIGQMNDAKGWGIKALFLLYSAFNSVGSSFSSIATKSIVVEIINYFQVLYGFSLVSLFVAGYVNQKAASES